MNSGKFSQQKCFRDYSHCQKTLRELRIFLSHSSENEHRKNKRQENFTFNLRVPPELASLRLNSGSFRICDLNSDHFVSQTEADRCSSNYFKNINREHIPIYHNRQRFIKFEILHNFISIININLS